MSTKTAIDISLTSLIKVLILFLTVVFLYFIRDIVVILFTTIIISSALDPTIDWLKGKHLPRSLSVIIVYVFVLAVIAGSVSLLVPPIAGEVKELAGKLPDLYQNLQVYLSGDSPLYDPMIAEEIQKALSGLGDNLSKITGGIFGTVSDIFGGLFSVVIILTMSFYLVVQENALKKFLRSITPTKHQPYVTSLVNRIQQKIGAWLRAQLILVLAVGVLTFVGLSLLKVPYALVLAIFAGLMEVVPYIGPIISVIPAAFLAITVTGSWVMLAGVILVYFVVQQLENHLLVPKVMHKAVGLNPIVVILSLMIGGKLAGFLGVILAVPVATALVIFVKDIIGERE